MGYRLHYARKYDGDYDGGYFNNRVDEFDEMAINELDCYWTDEDNSEYEIEVDKIKEYITRLEKLPQDEPNEYFIDDEPYTNGEVVKILKEMIAGYDKQHDFIRFSWF